MTASEGLVEGLRGRLIVSCQAAPGSPLDRPDIIAAFACCAQQAGAGAIRANHGHNIAAIAAAVGLPIIGIKKRDVPGCAVYITPEWRDVLEAHAAGAQIIALDATARPRPGPDDAHTLLRRIKVDLGAVAMADISTLDEGLAAADAGADLIATTISGYTPYSATSADAGPDLRLVAELAKRTSVPVICEGRVHAPDQARMAIQAGAHAVVVGTAITATQWIAEQFVRALEA